MKENDQNDQSSPPGTPLDIHDELSPKQVALALGVSEASLKRWCDNGLLFSTRTAGGHRRISRGSVMRFLRERNQPPVRPELLGLPSATGHGELTVARVRKEVQAALEAGNEEPLRRAVFNYYLAKHSVSDVCDLLLTPAFKSIGTSWEHGKTEIYQERRACELCMRLLNDFRSRLPAIVPPAPHAIGGSLQGDPYALAPAMAELVLREAGWDAVNFGTNIPVDSFCSALSLQKPRLIWISVGFVSEAESFIASVAKLFAAARQHGSALVVGGRAVTPDLRRKIRYSAFCETFGDLASFAEALVPAKK